MRLLALGDTDLDSLVSNEIVDDRNEVKPVRVCEPAIEAVPPFVPVTSFAVKVVDELRDPLTGCVSVCGSDAVEVPLIVLSTDEEWLCGNESDEVAPTPEAVTKPLKLPVSGILGEIVGVKHTSVDTAYDVIIAAV